MSKMNYLKTLMNVYELPVKTNIKLKRIMNIKRLTPDMIEKFFQWYFHWKKICPKLDSNYTDILVCNQKQIRPLSYMLDDTGSIIEYLLTDSFNTERKILVSLRIENGKISITKKHTYTNFKKEYNVTMDNHMSEIDSAQGIDVFRALRDLMEFSFATQIDLIQQKYITEEQGNEAIPYWVFERKFLL